MLGGYRLAAVVAERLLIALKASRPCLKVQERFRKGCYAKPYQAISNLKPQTQSPS